MAPHQFYTCGVQQGACRGQGTWTSPGLLFLFPWLHDSLSPSSGVQPYAFFWHSQCFQVLGYNNPRLSPSSPGPRRVSCFFFFHFFFSIFFSCFFVVTFLLPHRVLSYIQISRPVFFLSWYKTQKIYRLKHIFFRLKHFSASSSVAWSDLFPIVGKHISRTSWSFKTETLCPLTNNSPPLLPQPSKHPSTFCLDESDYCRYFM